MDEVMVEFNAEVELNASIDELFFGSPREPSHTEEPTQPETEVAEGAQADFTAGAEASPEDSQC